MTDSEIIKFILGIISGTISGMGIGGGTILITVLSCFMGMNQKVAQSSNIIFFIPTSIAATIINIKDKTLKIKKTIPIIIGGIVGVFIGVQILKQIDTRILKKLFGIFLILITIREIISWYNKYIKKT